MFCQSLSSVWHAVNNLLAIPGKLQQKQRETDSLLNDFALEVLNRFHLLKSYAMPQNPDNGRAAAMLVSFYLPSGNRVLQFLLAYNRRLIGATIDCIATHPHTLHSSGTNSILFCQVYRSARRYFFIIPQSSSNNNRPLSFTAQCMKIIQQAKKLDLCRRSEEKSLLLFWFMLVHMAHEQ